METNETHILRRLQEIYLETTVESKLHPGTRSLRELWQESWKPILAEQYELRSRLKAIRVGNPAWTQTRTGYAVAGWSQPHGYFRNRYGVFDTLEQAQACLKELKADLEWNLPTLLIKMSYWLANSPVPEFFETAPVHQLGFANAQEVVVKDKMGRGGVAWVDLLSCSGNGGVYTY